jgi:type IV pilus assembly protein PilM
MPFLYLCLGAAPAVLSLQTQAAEGESSMAINLSRTPYSPIAVDLGADSIKLLQVALTNPPQLVAAAAVQVPDDARSDLNARTAFFADALKDLLSKTPFKGRRAILSIPAYLAMIQHFQITRVERETLEDQINTHLRQRLNIDPDRMVIRNFEVGEISRDGSTRQEVICLAVSKDAVMRQIDLAKRAKLDVVGMQCEPLAVIQSMAHLYQRANDALRVTGFIDLGAAATKIVIAHGTKMVFAKTIHSAGEHFTRQIAEMKGLRFSEAKSARIQLSGPHNAFKPNPTTQAVHGRTTAQQSQNTHPVSAATSATQTQTQIDPAATALAKDRSLNDPHNFRETLDCLLDELHLCVRYHHNVFPQSPIEKLVFLGGESRFTGICQEVARSLRIGAQLGDPLARVVKATQLASAMGVDLTLPQPGWAVPMGLCLSEAVV